MKIEVTQDIFRLAQVFTISRGSRTQAEVLTVAVEEDSVRGAGECVPYARYGETLQSVTVQIEGFSGRWSDLPLAMPAGAARNALDCAFWDHAAKAAGKRVWDLLGLPLSLIHISQ
ncbi:MAG: dipeptide epimerase, partial [Paracoccaceae bacterium]|nr:dipeptide epimerase [Paracoccaceae bacterium]